MSTRILIVDDAPFIREVLRHLLIKNDFTVVGEAVDGQHAVELATQMEPDVVLMDMVMPRKTGIEATKEILSTHPQIRVIACSTVDQQSMVLKALDAGCCDFVVKPFQAEQLVKVIQSAVRIRKRG